MGGIVLGRALSRACRLDVVQSVRGTFVEERIRTGYGVLAKEVNLEDGFGVGKFQVL